MKKKKKTSWKKVALTIGAIGIIAGSATVVKRIVDPRETVIEVIDGDTFKISDKQNIRLAGLDAPEIQYCFGKESKEALENKILGKKVVIKEPRTDIYRRVVALVYLDGELVNEYMAKNGYALHRAGSNSMTPVIRDANNFARENNLGIFSNECSPLTPPKTTCTIKGQIPYTTGDKIYLTPDCRYYDVSEVERYRGEDWFCTEKEAKAAGFIKSSNCSI